MSALDNTDLPTVAMLGVGSMGGAILEGLISPGVNISTPIRVTTHSAASAEKFNALHDVVAHSLERDAEANRVAVRGAKLVIVGVKPWMVIDLLREVAHELEPDAVVISVAAGVTTERMESVLPRSVSVVRAMPNTPSLVGQGVTGIVGGVTATASAIDLAHRLFHTVGKVIRVEDEDQLDALSAVSGSGPAYVFLFIEKLTEATQRLGFSEDQARTMVEGTFFGASVLLAHEGTSPAELRRRVTSPNGTTERAIARFLEAGLDDIMDEALAAAITRSKELASGD